jgi:hypothetical protein
MNYLTFSIGIFIVLFVLIQSIKPSFLYNTDGSLRPFGIGYRKKTVVPLWLVVILLSIFTYSVAIYFIQT